MEFIPFKDSDRFYLHDNQGNYWIHNAVSSQKLKSDEPGEPWSSNKEQNCLIQNGQTSRYSRNVCFGYVVIDDEYVLSMSTSRVTKYLVYVNKYGLFYHSAFENDKIKTHVEFVSSFMNGLK